MHLRERYWLMKFTSTRIFTVHKSDMHYDDYWREPRLTAENVSPSG